MHTIEPDARSNSLPQVAWGALVLIWGTTWLGVRIGLDDLPPLTFAGIRFLVASVVLFAVLWVRGTRLPRHRSDWALVGTTAVLGFAVSYSAQFWGMQFVPSGSAAVIFATVPLFTLVFAHFALPSEPMRPSALAGVLLGLVGVAVIFSDQLAADDPKAFWGSAVFLLGAASYSAAQVITKARAGHLDPMLLAALQMAIASGLLLGLGTALEGNPFRIVWTGRAVLAVLYLALVGSALGFFLFYWLLRRMEVTKTLTMMLLHPPVAIVLGWFVLGETLGWRVFVGTAGIIAGLSLILTPKRTRDRAGGSELDLNRVRRLPATRAGRVRVTRRSA